MPALAAPVKPAAAVKVAWPFGLHCEAARAALTAQGAFGSVRRYALNNDELAHLAWYNPRVESYREAELAHLCGVCYLDYAGAALYSRAQLAAASAALLGGVLANPHSSPATADLVAQARATVLEMFGVSADTHTLVFTSGATQALQLVGENFAWSRDSIFLYAEENHTSAVGLRQFANRADANCGYFDLDSDLPHLAGDPLERVRPLEGARWAPPAAAESEAANLVVFPGESNFSGARADLDCVPRLRTGPRRWRVLLDAAKLACSPGALDLAACPADFTAVSFYKIFGYPTGLGALIVRHDAAPLLAPSRTMGGATGPEGAFGPSYFGGGCVSSISATSGFAVPRPALAEWLERGTSNFLGIAALPSQLACLEELGSAGVRWRHTSAVCREAYVRMRALRHRSGRPLCTIFGRHEEHLWWKWQGPTIACVMRYADGSCLPYGLVAEKAKERSVVLRTGCHCNAGACMKHLNLEDKDIRYFFASGKVCGDDLGVIDGRHTGVVRISFGTFSTMDDVNRWISLLAEEFVDRLPAEQPCESCGEVAAAAVAGAPPHPVAAVEAPLRPAATAEGPSASATALATARVPSSIGSVVAIKVYPIKGCGPLSVRRWPLDPSTGALFLDRRWCVAAGGASQQRVRPISAKQAPKLTQVQLSLRHLRRSSGADSSAARGLALVLSAKGAAADLEVPLPEADADVLLRSGAEVAISEAAGAAGGEAVAESASAPGAALADQVARWFEALLSLPSVRFVEAGVAAAGTGEMPAPDRSQQHFANAPSTLLLVSTSSLRDFGRLCGLPVPSERFRANLEVDFSEPYVEAGWPIGGGVSVGRAAFEAAGRCVRCQAVDIDPDDPAAKGPSLLAALATAQAGGGGSKGPTFGTLLRPRGSRSAASGSSLDVLAVGMAVEPEAGSARAAAEVTVFA